MDSFPSKEYLAIAFAYGVSVSALYLFGFWGVFRINVLEFIGLADLAKLSVKPLIDSLPAILLGFAIGQLFSGSFPPGGGAGTPIGQFGRKKYGLLLFLNVVIILALVAFLPHQVLSIEKEQLQRYSCFGRTVNPSRWAASRRR